MKLSIIIPVYNEEQTIGEVIDRVWKVDLGKGAAVRMGLAFATGDILLVQDADLELDPNEYVRLVAPILDGRTDIVYGSRFLAPTARVALSRRIANRFLTTLTNVLFGGR